MYTSAVIGADFREFPYDHQLREFEHHAEDPARALFWQPRTGKSKAEIDRACHLGRARLIDTVVVWAPNGVHENWIRRELVKHHWDMPYEAVYWRTSLAGDKAPIDDRVEWMDRFERALLHDGLSWFSFASATVTRAEVRRLLARIVRRRGPIKVVFDESHDYRKPGSKRTKMARAFANKCTFRSILTGTPVHNSPLHAYSQLELLKPGWSGHGRFDAFERRYAEYEMRETRDGRRYPALIGYRHLDELQAAMAPFASVVLRDECLDMPALVLEDLYVQPTEEQLRLYRELHREFELRLDSGEEVTLGERTNRLAKMQQVMSGFIRDEFGDVRWLSANPRLEALRDECSLGGLAVVWCQQRPDIDAVCKALRADGWTVLEYHGRTSDSDKARVREVMAPEYEGERPDFVVGQSQAGGSGLDFSAASRIINYSHTFDAIVREQSDERATAVGGDNVHVLDIIMPGTDPYMRTVRQGKLDIAGVLSREGLRELVERTRA